MRDHERGGPVRLLVVLCGDIGTRLLGTGDLLSDGYLALRRLRCVERKCAQVLLVLFQPTDEAAEARRLKAQKIPRYMPPST